MILEALEGLFLILSIEVVDNGHFSQVFLLETVAPVRQNIFVETKGALHIATSNGATPTPTPTSWRGSDVERLRDRLNSDSGSVTQ